MADRKFSIKSILACGSLGQSENLIKTEEPLSGGMIAFSYSGCGDTVLL